ncbi:MAG: glycosyltransferase family 61 protein [Moorea sp. SIO2I5]|nr:glycosyltransferase family 61 protein [Moorena sp. SIO2I5]
MFTARYIRKFSSVIGRFYKMNPPICPNIRQWCYDKSHHKHKVCEIVNPLIKESELIIRKLPKTVEHKIASKFKQKQEYLVPEKYLVKLFAARIIGPEGMLILPDGQYCLENAFGTNHLTLKWEYFSILKPKTVRKEGIYYSLLQLMSGHNYYHWIHDSLQKIYLIKDLLPPDILYIVPANLKSWQLHSLKLLDVNLDNLRYFSGEEVWQLEQLYYSPTNTVSGHDSTESNEWLRSVFYQKLGIHTKSSEKTLNIYISRSQATSRRIVNESDLLSLLDKWGFERFWLENMTLPEQIVLFSKAKSVVAPHGAGLTNLLFSQLGTNVLEIFEPNHFNSLCYWSMSESMGHNYWYMLGDRELSESPDIYVSPYKLNQALQEISDHNL